MLRIPVICALMILILGTLPSIEASELYTWTDDDGVTHYATSLDDVPEEYRDRVEILGFERGPEPATGGEEPGDDGPVVENDGAGGDEGPQLKRFEVPYEPYEGSTPRIILTVTFNDRVTAPMALDTGSPGMIISLELALKLGVFSGHSGTLITEAAGIGGVQVAILTIVDSVSVGEARTPFVPATVTPTVSHAFEGLIGMDFLAGYTISIDSQKHVVVFQEAPPQQNSRGGHSEAWWRKTFSEFRAARDYWRERAQALDDRRQTTLSDFVRFQEQEAVRLLRRLDLFASDNAVPRNWR